MRFLFNRMAVPVFFLLCGLWVNAQDFQGIVTYQSKTTLDPNFGGNRFNEQQRKQIAERMRSQLEKVYFLSFNGSASVYEEEEKLDAPTAGPGGRGRGGRFGFFARGGLGGSGDVYKNISEDVYAQESEISGKKFLIKDGLEKLEWKLENESKMIGDYAVFKATAVRKIEDFGFRGRRFGRDGREREQNEKDSTATASNNDEITINIPEEETITAWYTPQIPIGHGPGNYWGLPGLILEVSAGRTTILCTRIVLNPKEKVEIEAPSKGKEVSREEYAEIVKERIEEMRERFGRGNRRGNGRRF